MASAMEDSRLACMKSQWSSRSHFVIENARDTMNRIFVEASISPIRPQTRTKLQHRSKDSLHCLLSQLNRDTASLRGMIIYSSVMFSMSYGIEILGKLTEAFAPGRK